MSIISNWRITFSPASSPKVLVAYGDEIEAEPNWPLRRGLEVVPLADATAPFLRVSGNDLVTFGFTVYQDESLDTDARRKIMESLVSVGGYGKRPLKIEINGITDRYWEYANSFITDHDPMRSVDGLGRIAKRYSIVAAGLSQVGP